jgi:hypothetical protein
LKRFKFLYCSRETVKQVFQVILIHFLLISTESEMFQQMSQTILQSGPDSTENHFSGETETFLFLSESGTVPNTPLQSLKLFKYYVAIFLKAL